MPSRIKIDVESPLHIARSRAGLMLKHIGLSHSQRRVWFNRHSHLEAEALIAAVRAEFSRTPIRLTARKGNQP